MTKWTLVSAVVLAAIANAAALQAEGVKPVNGSPAIRGYDAVAYFKESRAVEGRREFRHDWNGATWLFSSAANRDAFAAAPEQYAPQYGGYCAYAVSQGYTANVDPNAWSIAGGRLFLNYSMQVRTKWEADKTGYITKADTNWPRLLKEGSPEP